jgi:hypothetical protein
MTTKTHALITVPQGIGDIFWVYQKTAPYFDELSFRIFTCGDARLDIQRRSESIISYLPRVRRVTCEPVTISGASRFLQRKIELKEVLKRAKGREEARFAYAVHPWLESGVSLEDIDSGLQVIYDVPLPMERVAPLFPGVYLVLYVSGDTLRHYQHMDYLWEPEQWVRFVERFCYVHGVGTELPVAVIGAHFDALVAHDLAAKLCSKGFTAFPLLGMSAPRLFYTLKNCRFFVGYQSGLSMLADNLDVNQVIVYFPCFTQIADTWVKPKNRGTGLFNAASFDEDPLQVAERVKVVPMFTSPAERSTRWFTPW